MISPKSAKLLSFTRRSFTYISQNRFACCLIAFLFLLLTLKPSPTFENTYCTQGYCLTTPSLAVDMVIFKGEKSLAVSRKNRPVGLALGEGGHCEERTTITRSKQRQLVARLLADNAGSRYSTLLSFGRRCLRSF